MREPEPTFGAGDVIFGNVPARSVGEADQTFRGFERLFASPMKPPAIPRRKVPCCYPQIVSAFPIRPLTCLALRHRNGTFAPHHGVRVEDQVVRDSVLYFFVPADGSGICLKGKAEHVPQNGHRLKPLISPIWFSSPARGCRYEALQIFQERETRIKRATFSVATGTTA
jgi:hypothetical protein